MRRANAGNTSFMCTIVHFQVMSSPKVLTHEKVAVPVQKKARACKFCKYHVYASLVCRQWRVYLGYDRETCFQLASY